MEFIDTHSHLYLDEFKDDIDIVISRAKGEGVSRIILPNIDSFSIHPLLNLVNRDSELFIPLMGLHPTHVKDNYTAELEIIFNEIRSHSFRGIGEIGIDLYWDKTHRNEQIDAFRMQLKYALDNSLPVVIHARESFEEILRTIKLPEFIGLKGIFHAYTGDKKLANGITDMGFKLGIGGILTFKNSGLAETIRDIELKHFVLETDSPYLAPVPFRGKRNESSYISLVAKYLAEIKGITIEEVARITTLNAREVFSL